MRKLADLIGSLAGPSSATTGVRSQRHVAGGRMFWAALLLPSVLIGVAYSDSLVYLLEQWTTDETYGHGLFVPLISAYLIWMRREQLGRLEVGPSWWGVPVLLLGLGLYVIGELTTLYVALHLSLWVVIVGVFLSAIGPRGLKVIGFPVCFLLTMIPLPQLLHQNLSAELQLLSSALGVGFLQLVGVTAFREGNVIDLGSLQLQVVEACSGLRYLFPLLSLSLLCAYLFHDRMWKRMVLVLSCIPIAILLNGFRIGIIGLLVDRYGEGAATGFSHFFEGWVLFVASLVLLRLTIWGLDRLNPQGPERSPAGWLAASVDRIRQETVGTVQTGVTGPIFRSSAYLVSVGLLGCLALASTQVTLGEEAVPAREAFVDFPKQVGGWQGETHPMERVYVDTLRLDDYLLADFREPQGPPLNVYVAYYHSQKKGQSAHSPKSCLPGGGWEILSFERVSVPQPNQADSRFPANRVVIQKGDAKQIVLYWFKQRDRTLANEYLVKLFLLWDALKKRRTDGALVRLTAWVQAGENEDAADRRLLDFVKVITPLLARYVPD